MATVTNTVEVSQALQEFADKYGFKVTLPGSFPVVEVGNGWIVFGDKELSLSSGSSTNLESACWSAEDFDANNFAVPTPVQYGSGSQGLQAKS